MAVVIDQLEVVPEPIPAARGADDSGAGAGRPSTGELEPAMMSVWRRAAARRARLWAD